MHYSFVQSHTVKMSNYHAERALRRDVTTRGVWVVVHQQQQWWQSRGERWLLIKSRFLYVISIWIWSRAQTWLQLYVTVAWQNDKITKHKQMREERQLYYNIILYLFDFSLVLWYYSVLKIYKNKNWLVFNAQENIYELIRIECFRIIVVLNLSWVLQDYLILQMMSAKGLMDKE